MLGQIGREGQGNNDCPVHASRRVPYSAVPFRPGCLDLPLLSRATLVSFMETKKKGRKREREREREREEREREREREREKRERERQKRKRK